MVGGIRAPGVSQKRGGCALWSGGCWTLRTLVLRSRTCSKKTLTALTMQTIRIYSTADGSTFSCVLTWRSDLVLLYAAHEEEELEYREVQENTMRLGTWGRQNTAHSKHEHHTCRAPSRSGGI
jgi:hypothetical protein